MTSIGQVLLRAKRWISAHPRALMLALPIFFLALFAVEVWSIFSSVPDLPSGRLQMVGTSFDGARFVVVNDQGRASGGDTITILVVLREPLRHEQGVVRFAVKRVFVDCANRQIELRGAGFYDDEGQRTIARVYDEAPRAFDSLDTEVGLVCDGAVLAAPVVWGYRAALARTMDVAPNN